MACPIMYAAQGILEQLAPDRLIRPKQLYPSLGFDGPMYDIRSGCVSWRCSWFGDGCPKWTKEKVEERKERLNELFDILEKVKSNISKNAYNKLERKLGDLKYRLCDVYLDDRDPIESLAVMAGGRTRKLIRGLFNIEPNGQEE